MVEVPKIKLGETEVFSSAFIVDDVPTTTVGMVARVPNTGIYL